MNAEQPILLRFRWTFDLNRRSQAEIQQRQALEFFGFAVVIFTVVRSLTTFADQTLVWSWTWSAFASFSIVAGVISWSYTEQKRRFAMRPDANMDLAWWITQNELVAWGGDMRTVMQWSQFKALRLTKSGFLLYPHHEEHCYYFPKHAFEESDSHERFIELAQLRGLEVKRALNTQNFMPLNLIR